MPFSFQVTPRPRPVNSSFNVNAGIACQECHGDVQDMKRVYMVPQMQITKRSLFTPSQKLEMGWCMECHLQRGGPDDCVSCHY